MSTIETTQGAVVPKRRPFQVRLSTRETIAAYAFLAPFIIFFSVFVIRAIFSAVNMSFYEYALLKPVRPYVGLGNYQELFSDYVWWIAVKNTIIFTVLTVAGTTTVALVSAVAVTQPIKGANFFRVLLYMPQLLSVGVVGLIWVWLLSTQFGVINYFLGFIGISPINWLGDEYTVIPALSLTTIWWGFGFPMLIFIAGLQGIPEHLYEAARIDGASGRQLFFYITLPLLRPTILFVTVTGVIAQFQVFGQPFIMTTGGPGRASYTVIYYLYEIAWRSFRMGYGSAVAVALAVIMAVFTLFQFRVLGQRVDY
ncbi:MAG: sugar ABC transporter permease [Chloroflexi bacterium]|nr:sugar ABC transporter permease [Chloroflexota bacterium]MCC6897220.1 sugar ABC transporter permease [Anaerolineae bacterium]